MAVCDDCFKIDMGCECEPPPPDMPRPFVFAFVNSTTEASATAQINFTSNASGVITGYSIISTGNNYRIAPTITIGGSGSGATATCTINGTGAITGVTITAGGTGYGAAATVTSTISYTPNNLITFDSLASVHSFPVTYSFQPVNRLALAPPPGAGAGITLATAKINLKLSGTVKTNGVTNFTGTYYHNGNPVSTTITVDQTAETETPFTHYSGELTMNLGDIITYKISSTESKLYNIGFVVGDFTVRYI